MIALCLSGCALWPWSKSSPPPAVPAANGPASTDSKLIVTPAQVLTGKVVRANPTARFVVLEFPPGQLPAADRRMFIYRQGLKVGEIKVTGPHRDVYTVGDIMSGEAQAGDEVRDK